MLGTFTFSSLLLMLMASTTLAQNSQVTGTVLDSLSSEPLIGTNVLVVGTSRGTSADVNGRFTITRLDAGVHILRFTFIGYSPAETTVTVATDDSVSLRILLKPHHIESPIVVITGTRTVRSIADVPVRVEAIPEKEIEEKLLMTPSNVAMLLNESTGMRVQTTSAAISTANLRIQGLSGRYTQILNDGIPSLGGLSAGLSFTQLVPLDLRQVEILKGATSSLYGGDAIAGVVNFLPKIPGEVSETHLLLNATTQKGGDAAGFYSERFGETGLSILASHNRQARYDVDGDGFADVAQYERTTVTPRLLHHFSSDLSLRVGLSILDENRIGGAMNESLSPGMSSLPYTEKIRTNRFDASSQIDWQPSPTEQILIKLALLSSKRDALFGGEPFKGVQTVSFADVQYSIDFSNHNLLLGSAFRIDDFQDQTPNLLSGRSFRFSVPSIFVQDEFQAAEALSFVLSGRLDFHNVFGTFFVPRVSAMFRPLSSLTFRIGGGTGYKAPTIFVEEAEEIGFRSVRPLTNTRPENARSLSIDVNWRATLGSFTIDWNSAMFLTNVDDALLADEDSLQADVVYLRNSTGFTRSVGGEFSLRLTYADFKASVGYTYLYASQEHDLRRSEVELNPRHSLGLVIIWESHEQQLKMGLENYWTGQQHVQRNPFRSSTPSYWITGFMAEKGFGNVKLFVNLENIFDTRQTRYEPIFIGNLASGNIRTLPVYAPLEGRVVNVGIRYVLRSSN
jgi:outer membrane receptor for ferrienterochelin and colicins